MSLGERRRSSHSLFCKFSDLLDSVVAFLFQSRSSVIYSLLLLYSSSYPLQLAAASNEIGTQDVLISSYSLCFTYYAGS